MYSTKSIDWISKIQQRGKAGNFKLISIYLFHIKIIFLQVSVMNAKIRSLHSVLFLTNLESILLHGSKAININSNFNQNSSKCTILSSINLQLKSIHCSFILKKWLHTINVC